MGFFIGQKMQPCDYSKWAKYGKMPGGGGSEGLQIHVVKGTCPCQLLCLSGTCGGHHISRNYMAPAFQEHFSWLGKREYTEMINWQSGAAQA